MYDLGHIWPLSIFMFFFSTSQLAPKLKNADVPDLKFRVICPRQKNILATYFNESITKLNAYIRLQTDSSMMLILSSN